MSHWYSFAAGALIGVLLGALVRVCWLRHDDSLAQWRMGAGL